MTQGQRPKKSSPKKVHAVDALFKQKIKKRITEKEAGERKRLGPRWRFTKLLFDADAKELQHKSANGFSMPPERRIEIIERAMKSLCKLLGHEEPSKKDKED
jgi:hypothetical protein